MNTWECKTDFKLVWCLAGVALESFHSEKEESKKTTRSAGCLCVIWLKNLNNQIQCCDYWHSFIRCPKEKLKNDQL